MKYHFKIEGITCKNCVPIIKDLILSDPVIASKDPFIDINAILGEMVVELKEEFNPECIINAINGKGGVRSKYHVSSCHVLDKQYTYYFELKPKNSEKEDLEYDLFSALTKIKEGLMTELYVKDVEIDADISRIKVSAKSHSLSAITLHINGLNHEAKHLVQKKTYHFVIKGFSSDSEKLIAARLLQNHKTEVDSFQIITKSNILIVTVVNGGFPASTEELKEKIKASISEAVEDPAFVIEDTQSPIKELDDAKMPKIYFLQFTLNLLVGIGFIALNLFGLILPPVTLLGQLMGLFLGGVTLGVMWHTGKEFYLGAWQKFMKDRSTDMDAMIALGTGSAWVYSMTMVLFPLLFPLGALQYQFLAVNMILGITNLGRSVKEKAKERTNKKIKSLTQVFVNSQNQVAKKLKINSLSDLLDEPENIEFIDYREVKKGDILKVDEGEIFPVEGKIVKGETMVNQATMTGEASPCSIKVNDQVYSGTLNIKKTVYVQASCDGVKGKLTKLIKDVEESNTKFRLEGSRISSLVDKLARVFVPTIVGLSVLTALGWYMFGPAPQLPWMIKSAMSVLLCACPCALLLATPISTTISIYKLFNNGIIVRNANALESAADIDTIYFDKTDTLTELTAIVKERIYTQGKNVEEILNLAASVEDAHIKNRNFDHPIARILISENSSSTFLPCSDLKHSDHGLSGEIANEQISVGSRSYLEKGNVHIDEQFKIREEANDKAGYTSVFIAVNNKCVAIIPVEQKPRKEAAEQIAKLKKLGITEICLLTGDNEAAARNVAKELGIEKVFSGKTGEEKERIIKGIVSDPKRRGAMFVGDGMNDLKAIGASNVGVAVGGWTSAASCADIITRNLKDISTLILIARETKGNIYQNLWGTGFYNLISLSAAMGLGYLWFGLSISPVVASLAMACSSIVVVFNSSRLAFVIDDVVSTHENKLKPTLWQKLVKVCSLRTQIQTLKMFFSDESEDDNSSMKYYVIPNNAYQFSPEKTFTPARSTITPMRIKEEVRELEAPIMVDASPPRGERNRDLSSYDSQQRAENRENGRKGSQPRRLFNM